jgi:hypothetical protein
MRRSIQTVMAGLGAVAAFLTGGCVTEGGRQRPELPTPPSDLRVTQVMVAVGMPEDTDRNQYLDTYPVTVYLFDDRFPLPVHAEADFSFEMIFRTDKGEVIDRRRPRWSFSAVEANNRVARREPGLCFEFRLSLLDHGGDRIDDASGQLELTIRPKGGDEVRAQPVAMQCGRISMGR